MRAWTQTLLGRLSVPVSCFVLVLLSTVPIWAQGYYYQDSPYRVYPPYSAGAGQLRYYPPPYPYPYQPGPAPGVAPHAYRPPASPNSSYYYAGRYVPPASAMNRQALVPPAITPVPSSPPAQAPAPETQYSPAGVGPLAPSSFVQPALPGFLTPTPTPALTQEDIKRVQSQLLRLGYELGWADGVLGPKTLKALAKFQKDNGLTDPVPVGAATLAMLNSVSDSLRTVQKLRNYVPRMEAKSGGPTAANPQATPATAGGAAPASASGGSPPPAAQGTPLASAH